MDLFYEPDKLNDPNYTIGVLLSEMISTFGKEAQKKAESICYRRGRSLGKKLAAHVASGSFQDAVETFVEAGKRGQLSVELADLSPTHAVVRGTKCPLGLEGRGRSICESAMEIDRGILEEISGEKIGLTVITTVAENAPCCEVRFELSGADEGKNR